MQSYPKVIDGITDNPSPEGYVPVFYVNGEAAYFVGHAETTGEADKLGRQNANALCEVNKNYVDGFPYAFVNKAKNRDTGEVIAIILH